MKLFKQVALAGVLAVLGAGAVASSASAVTISPTNTDVLGSAGATEFNTSGVDVDCSGVTAEFNTGDGTGGPEDLYVEFSGCTAAGAAATVDCTRSGARTGEISVFSAAGSPNGEVALDNASCLISVWTGCNVTVPRSGTGTYALDITAVDNGTGNPGTITVHDGNAIPYGVSSSFLCAGGNSTAEWRANGGGDVVFTESGATDIDIS